MFAYFEYLLSFVAEFFDSEMLKLENLNYGDTSPTTVIFQRLSVIVVDIIYFLGVREWV
jgi:alpha-1,3-glucosyltransferase